MKKNSIISVIALMSVFTGCQKEDIQNADTKGHEFQVVTNVLSRSTTSFENDFRLFINQEGDEMDYDVVMKYEGSVWNAYVGDDKQTMIWKDPSSVPVTAVYLPYVEGNISSVDVKGELVRKISADQSSLELNDEDVLYYNNEVSGQPGILDIEFNHLLCTIELTYTPANLSADPTVSSIEITNVKNEYTWTPTEGVQSLQAAGDAQVKFKNDGDAYKCILPPQTLDGCYLEVTYSDGKTQTQKFNKATIVSGTKYTVSNFVYNPDATTGSCKPLGRRWFDS